MTDHYSGAPPNPFPSLPSCPPASPAASNSHKACTFQSSSLLVPRITSYNVRSLSFYASDPSAIARKGLINQCLKDVIRDNDVVCLQETNLAPSERLALSNLPHCQVSRNNLQLHQAGTVIIDCPSLTKFYSGNDIVLPAVAKGYVQLRRYTPTDGLHLPFQLFNVYFKSGHDYTVLSDLVNSMMKADCSVPTFVCGDFNFIESPSDSSSAKPLLPPAHFITLWNDFKAKFRLADADHDHHTFYHITSDPTSPYSWSSRLDRFLLPDSLFSHPLLSPSVSIRHHPTNFSLKTCHGPRHSFSDHLPVQLKFYEESSDKGNRPSIPSWLASSPEFADALKACWTNRESAHPFQTLSNFKAALFKAAKAARKVRLDNSSLSLRLSQHLTLFRLISQSKQDLPRIHSLLSNSSSLCSLVSFENSRWLDKGLEVSLRELTTQVSASRAQTPRNPIKALSDLLPNSKARLPTLRASADSPAVTSDADRSSVANDFWSPIWQKRSPVPPCLRTSFLKDYDKSVDLSLLEQPDLESVLKAIRGTNNSTAGPDGIPFAAWRAAPDLAAPVLLAALNALFKGHAPPEGFNHGLLFLLPKRATDIVSDTRPLSVTNTDNRILASIVAHHIMKATAKLIDPAQKGFLAGIDGTEHIVDVNEFFYTGVEEKIHRLLFLLDTAKAFDSIDHEWILHVLKKVGFPSWVINFVKGSFSQVKVSPFFGKFITCWIDILRGVKQGCPLSPLLFILAYDPLLHALRSLPGLRTFAFADDLALAAHSLDEISPALTLISSFSTVSGLGINKDKSCLLSTSPLSAHARIRTSLASCPWPDIPLKLSATYLGIPIGRDVTLGDIFCGPVTKALARIQKHKNTVQTLSVPMRVLFANVFIISLFSYHSLFFVLPPEYWTTIKAAIAKLVTPFNGGAYSYETLVCSHSLFSLNPALKDVWAYNVSLLAVRSPFISADCNYNDLPAIKLKLTRRICLHRDAAAIDFWRGRHLADGTLTPLPSRSSTLVYQSIIEDVYFEEASQHCANKLTNFLTRYQRAPSLLPDDLISNVSSNLALAKKLPQRILFHHFSLIQNALPTARRLRHQNKLSSDQVSSCHYCGEDQDSLTHLYSSCKIVSSARASFFSSPSTPISAPFAPSAPATTLEDCFLITTPPDLVVPTLVFNYAVWRFRGPAEASRSVMGFDWLCGKLVELSRTLLHSATLSKEKRRKPLASSEPHDIAVSSMPPGSLICYTDGSAMPNPGPCGAGATIFFPDHLVDLGAPLGIGTNNLAELYAMGICIQELIVEHKSSPFPAALICTDSRYVLGALSSTKTPKSHSTVVSALRQLYSRSLHLFKLSLLWVKGHLDIGGNERVDKISKSFARYSSNSPGSSFPSATSFLASRTRAHWPYGPLCSNPPIHCFSTALPSPSLPSSPFAVDSPARPRPAPTTLPVCPSAPAARKISLRSSMQSPGTAASSPAQLSAVGCKPRRSLLLDLTKPPPKKPRDSIVPTLRQTTICFDPLPQPLS